MEKSAKIYVAGHRGLVGSALCKVLQQKGYTNLLYRTHVELDLTNQQAVEGFFEQEKPEYVFLAAAKVGGIVANNTYRGAFIYENMMIQNNVIHQSYVHGVKKLLFLGSTCIYPKECPQPMREDSLLTGPLEYTNEPYAIAKIAGIKMCESYNLQYGTNFISVMPTNLYGPNDNFDLETSHVLPALLRKIKLAHYLETHNWDQIKKDLTNLPIENVDGTFSNEEIIDVLSKYGVQKLDNKWVVEIWGTGQPLREFLYSEDMADACIHIMENVNFKDTFDPTTKEVRNTHINIGTGKEISINALANLIKKTVGFQGELVFNPEKPDGTLRKLTDVSKLNELGWKFKVELENGIRKMYEWYQNNSMNNKKSRTVITYGTFDLLHYGHIEILRRASQLGNKLIVGLSTDEFNEIKGKNCKIPYEKRKELLESIEYVDKVIPESTWDQKIEDVKNNQADIFVMGDDWEGKFDFLKAFCKVTYLPRTIGISTTKLKTIINKG